jgi:hypothetical protein
MSSDPQFPLNEKLLQYNIAFTGRFPKISAYMAWRLSNTYDPDSLAVHLTYDKTLDNTLAMPASITLDAKDVSEYNRIMNDVNTATSEFYVQVITGGRPVSEVPAFLARLKTMGIDRAQAIQQAAFTKFMSK